ncbi:MAG: helicase-associated domain-containing protein [Anaerolineae bacterium]|nr:helicase-associated domain-containing protein [Anaerolineae bacterium]
MVPQLEATLQSYHINALQEIADQLALKSDRFPPRKGWLVTELGRLIPKMARSEAFIQALSDTERAALAILINCAEPTTLATVARPLMLAGLVHIEGQPEASRRPRTRDILSDLLRKGLIVNVTPPISSSDGRTLSLMSRFGIPEEVRSLLPTALLSEPQPDLGQVLARSVTPHHVVSRDLQAFLRELLFVWAHLRDQPAQRLKTGDIGKRDRRRLCAALALEEPDGLEKVAWLCHVLAALNLVTESPTEVTAVEGQAVTLFWGAKTSQYQRDLRQAYARMSSPLSSDRATSRLTGHLQGFDLRAPSDVRSQILATLVQASAPGWWSFSTLLSLLTGDQAGGLVLDDNILAVVYDQYRWYGSAYQREVEANLKGIERAWVQRALEELCAMGLVELGYSEADSKDLVALRTDQTLGQTVPSHQDQPWQVILQPDFQVLALGPIPLRVLAGIEQVAHREKIDESVVTYRLNRESIYRALRAGETVPTILAYLEETTGQPIPQNIHRSLEEWYRQYERITVRRSARILQVDSGERLTALLDDPQLGQHLHRIDDRSAWFVPEDTDLVRQRLQAHELLPAVSHGAQADLPNSMRWRDGELESRTALPSLYVSAALARFAEPHGNRWRLTPQSIQAAAALGTPPLEVIARLKMLTGAPPPDGLEKLVKAWGKHFGDGQTSQVRLLHLKRNEALAELRAADPALHRWLRPLPGLESLAIVNEAHWSEVMALLDSWGVEVASEHWW